MPYTRINDANIYYEIHGEGEPLLFISGLGGHVAEVAHLAESYARHVRFIGFDGRGCGRSECTSGDLSISGYAEDAAALLNALEIDSAFVYGSSMGGMIAQELALRHPHRVRGLILGCTTAGPVRGVKPSLDTIQRMVRNQLLNGDEAMVAGWELGYSRRFIEANYDAMVERGRAISSFSTPLDSYMKQVVAAARHDVWDRLHRIECPVMIVHGEDDVMIPVGNVRMMHERLPHAEVSILPGMGHGYNLEAQEHADRLVLDFLRRHIAVREMDAAGAVR